VQEKKTVLEALLFSTPYFLPVKKMAEATGWGEEEIEGILCELIEEYKERGIRIRRVAGEYQMTTAPTAASYVASLNNIIFASGLSKAAMETLAVIAYKQPLTRAEIEAVRGVRVDKILQTLREKKMVRKVGEAQTPGRPGLFGTTPEFLRYFGLNTLEDLPSLEPENSPQEALPDEGSLFFA